ncbi:hypothetical protein ABBQ38_014063 [Trebouxia sp. C0009 RCD-2024]
MLPLHVWAATATITVTSPTTAKLIANLGNSTLLNRVRSLAAGTATIAGSFGGSAATGLSMTIGAPAAAVTVTSVALSASWCTDVQCSGTFAGIPGSTSVLEARIVMSDAYTYTKVLGSAQQTLDIIDVSQILAFTSSLAASITAQSYGDVTLLANADTAVGTASDTTLVYANLNPAELDVDAGDPFGLQVQSQAGRAAAPVVLQTGASFAMNIRVNSASSPLIAFELRVNYPSSILTVASESDCSPGADWPANSLTFVCNARGSSSSVLMNSILQPPYSSQQGPNISVASIIFTAVAAGSGALSVDILGMAQQSGVGVSAPTPAVAAAGNVRVDPARRRRQLLRKDYGMQPGELLHPLAPPTQPAFQVKHHMGNGHLPIDAAHWQQDRRRLAVTPCDPTLSAAVYGDINFDCQYTFVQDVLLLDSLRGSWDSSDVSLYYNYLLANSTSAAANGLTAPLQHQRQQLDPAYKYYSALPASNANAIPRPDGTTATKLAALVGQACQAQPGSSEDKALYQLISARLTWFLDGVYVTLPTPTARSLNVTVRLRDTTSNLVTTGAFTQVQIPSEDTTNSCTVSCSHSVLPKYIAGLQIQAGCSLQWDQSVLASYMQDLSSTSIPYLQLEIRSGMAVTFQNTNGTAGSGSLTSGGTYLTTADFTGGGNFDTVVLPDLSSSSGCGSYADPTMQLAALVLSLDASGAVQNQSFYPYYGSAQKLVYQADALSSNVYSSTFTPYTTITLADTYPPAFRPGYPTAVNINDTSFTLSTAFYEVAAVFYVVLPAATGGVVTTPPAVVDVIAGNGPSGAVATASGSFTTAASGSGTAVVSGLLPATNYTAYMVARDASGNAQPLVSVLQGVVTPDTQPPTFLFLNFTAPVVDQNTGLFAMDMIVNTSEVSNIYYSIYRDYGSASQGACAITGNPPVATITAGGALPAANCACSDPQQCAAVNSSSFSSNATGWGAATLNGALSALPFSNIRNETCFDRSNLENPSDTCRVFMVASDSGPTYNGLTNACSPVTRLPAVPSGCPTTAFMDCSQVQERPDAQNFQTGTYVNWTLSNGTVAPAAANSPQTPLQFSVNLQDQVVPTFLTGPDFTPLPGGGSQISFALTVPGLVIFSVSNVTLVTQVDSPLGPGSLQVGNGRIPVFSGGPADIGYLSLKGCNGTTLVPSSQYLVQYWIRDKFATMDTVVQVKLITTGALH